jgi:hypothetical protein
MQTFTLLANASLAVPQAAWSKKTIHVCWGSISDVKYADLQSISKLLIEHSEYDSLSKAGKLPVGD